MRDAIFQHIGGHIDWAVIDGVFDLRRIEHGRCLRHACHANAKPETHQKPDCIVVHRTLKFQLPRRGVIEAVCGLIVAKLGRIGQIVPPTETMTRM
jgi:hypothetical protein